LGGEQDEWFYVMAGRYLVEIVGEMHNLGPSESIVATRGAAHRCALDGDETGCLLIAL